MKKNLWMLGAAVAALTSCTQSEVVEIPESRVIGFESHVDKTTRAMTQINGVGTQTNDLNKFYVYGYEGTTSYFDGTTVTYDGSKFTYNPHQQWKAGKTYDFAAYSNGNAVHTSSITYAQIPGGSQLTISDYTVGDNDLMAAIVAPISINAAASNTPDYVSLTFDHMLCVVTLSLTNGGSNYLKIGDIAVDGIKTNICNYSIMNGIKSCNWGTANVADDAYTFTGTGDDYIEPAGRHVVSLFFIPQSTDIAVAIPVTTYTKSGDTYVESTTETKNTTLKIVENDNTASWQNGKHYVYNGTLSGQVHYIHFDAMVTSWGEPVNNTLIFSN